MNWIYRAKKYIKTINGRSPDINGNITVIEGGGSSSYGSYRLDATILTTDWQGSGPYTVRITNQYITSSMDGNETWLDDPTAMLGETSFTTGAGYLDISTIVKPTATWSLHVSLAVNGADVLQSNNYTQQEIAIVQTGDTATENIAKGKYVSWNNVLHVASSAISTGDTLSASNLTAVTGGAANSLNASIAKLGVDGAIATNSLLSDAVAATGTRVFILGGAGYTAGDVPNGGGAATYSSAIVIVRGSERNVILVDTYGNMWTNVYTSGQWKGWHKIVYRNVGLVDGISLSSYTSTSNQYKCPADGYIRVMSGDTVGDYAIAYVNGKVLATAKTQVVNLREYNAFQVKAGMSVYCVISGTASNCHYFQIA